MAEMEDAKAVGSVRLVRGVVVGGLVESESEVGSKAVTEGRVDWYFRSGVGERLGEVAVAVQGSGDESESESARFTARKSSSAAEEDEEELE